MYTFGLAVVDVHFPIDTFEAYGVGSSGTVFSHIRALMRCISSVGFLVHTYRISVPFSNPSSFEEFLVQLHVFRLATEC